MDRSNNNILIVVNDQIVAICLWEKLYNEGKKIKIKIKCHFNGPWEVSKCLKHLLCMQMAGLCFIAQVQTHHTHTYTYTWERERCAETETNAENVDRYREIDHEQHCSVGRCTDILSCSCFKFPAVKLRDHRVILFHFSFHCFETVSSFFSCCCDKNKKPYQKTPKPLTKAT